MTTSDELLRLLARALAPYIADELGIAAVERPKVSSRYDAATCRRFVDESSLGDHVLLRAQRFFRHLSENGQIGSLELVALLELKGPTSIPANLTNPLKKRAAKIEVPLPWDEGLGPDDRTVWLDRDGNAARLSRVIDEEVVRRQLVIASNPSKFVWHEGDVEFLTPAEAKRIIESEGFGGPAPGGDS